jgi:hypothetical protein
MKYLFDNFNAVNIQAIGLYDYLNQYWHWAEQLIYATDDELTFESRAFRYLHGAAEGM